MNSVAGSGSLMSADREVPVAYDLVQAPELSPYTAEGQVFGDVGALRDVFNNGPCQLRLVSGLVTKAVLLNCETRGAADIRITGPMQWTR